MSGRAVPISGRRRRAAIVALAGTVGLVVFVVQALLGDGLRLVFALAGVCLMVSGGWWAVTEQMPRRAVGILGVVLGLAVVVVSLIIGLDNAENVGVRTLQVVLLLLLTLGSARAAMVRELHDSDVRVRMRSRPARAVLLCNPWSGGGKVARFGLVDLANELGVETVMLDHGLDLEQLARSAVARGADCLGMAGGDGSQALVATCPWACTPRSSRRRHAARRRCRRRPSSLSCWVGNDSGKLGVFAVTTRTGTEAARLFAATALGRRHRSPFWREFVTTEFEIWSRSGTVFARVDGEALELAAPLRLSIHARGLRLLVPSDNIRAAERRRSRDVHLGDLLAVAAGREVRRDARSGSAVQDHDPSRA